MKDGKRSINVLMGIFFLVLCWFHLSAEQTGSKDRISASSSLKDLVEFGVKHNPGLKSIYYRWKGEMERIAQTDAMPDPIVSFAYFMKGVETRVGAQQSKIGMMQKFPWFGKLKLKSRVIREQVKAFEQNFFNEKSIIEFEIKKSYYQYYFLLKKSKILKENIKLLRYFEKVAEAKYQSGLVPLSDLIKIQIERERLQDLFLDSRDLYESGRGIINSILNRPLQAILPFPQKIPFPRMKITLPELMAQAYESNPGLKSIDFQITGNKAGVDLSRKNFYPDITLGFDYIFTGDSPLDPVLSYRNDPFVVKAQINIPVNFNKLRSSVRQGIYMVQSMENRKMDFLSRLETKLERAFTGFNQARNRAELYQKSLIPKGKQIVNITQSAYEVNKADVRQLIDSYKTVLDLDLMLQKTLVRQAERFAELELLVGETLSEENVDDPYN